MTVERILPHIRVRWTPEPPVDTDKKVVYNGPKPHVVSDRKHVLPDNAILEMRRLHETDGMGAADISSRMKLHGVEVTRGSVYSIINYGYRAHLVPKDTTVSYLFAV